MSDEIVRRAADVFSDGGPLARALPSFEPRESQRGMATAVAQTLESGGVLLAEAGTGTGKTLAYLVPAILSGQRVLVSTGTKNLQEQIFTKDLPLLAQALSVRFRAALMKGRGNYLCLHRFEEFRKSPVFRSDTDRIHFTLVESWSESTTTGDRGEIEQLPDELPFWPQISATAEHCLGATCPQYGDCYVSKMRQRAAEADVVIVNHHLLCADAAVRHHAFGEVIPECPAAIVDEAHQLEDVATQYFGVGVSSHRLDELVSDVERALRRGDLSNADEALRVGQATMGVHASALDFFRAVAQVSGEETSLGGAAPFAGRKRAGAGLFDERRRVTADSLDPAGEAGLTLIGALDALARAFGLVKEAREDVAALERRAAETRDDVRFLLRADDPAFVYFVESRGSGIFLRALPIDVSGLVRDRLFDRFRTTVLTSATLRVGESFDYVARRLGIGDARRIALDSEFDHARQSVLYLPRRMPDPRQAEFTSRVADEVTAILHRTEGRAFVLFTSHAALRAARERLERTLSYPLLVQGSAPRGVLLDQFRRTANAVLLATSSFWQGVDVGGEALSCVVIDRLPFASPGDPIVAARMEAISARGGDPFDEYQVPLAILTLRQGLGRLLRHRDDRGVLAILDPRLQTMGYGRRFLASLPPSPITRELDEISRFFDRAGGTPLPS
jgi:ATP-dependent DNA helicase DinG